MKVLMFSDSGLPDIRLDRYAYLVSEYLGYDTYFYGDKEVKSLHTFDFFKEKTTNRISRSAKLGLPYFYRKYKQEFKLYYKTLKPDIVHAHNLFCGKICLDLNIPYIYDDHEYWYYQAKARNKASIPRFSKRHITNRIFSYKINNWEKEVIKNAESVITVSDTIRDEHKKINRNTITIPNFPCRYEINQIPNSFASKDELRVCFIIRSSGKGQGSINKYIDAFDKNDMDLTIIGNYNETHRNIDNKGFLTISELNKALPQFHIGLYYFPEDKRKVGYFKYLSPNRVFQYLHAGLTPIIHKEMDYLRNLLGNHAIYIDDESESMDKINILKSDKEFLKNNPNKIQRFARENLVFDKYKNDLQHIYLNNN